jgi:hypothetical protein
MSITRINYSYANVVGTLRVPLLLIIKEHQDEHIQDVPDCCRGIIIVNAGCNKHRCWR